MESNSNNAAAATPYNNGHTSKSKKYFTHVPISEYNHLLKIVTTRLPESVGFCNTIKLASATAASSGEGTITFYTYGGILDTDSIVVASGVVKGTDTDVGIPMTFISVPTHIQLSSEIADRYVAQFYSGDTTATAATLFVSPRRVSSALSQAILDSGTALQIRICNLYQLNEAKWATFQEQQHGHGQVTDKVPIPTTTATVVKPLNPEDSIKIDQHFSFGCWTDVAEYARRCIINNPSIGVYSKDSDGDGDNVGELCSWAVCYDFGWAGMLHTPAAHRGKGYGAVVMNAIMHQMKDKGLNLLTAVEPKNFTSQRLMTRIGFEKLFPLDFIFAHEVKH